MLVKGQFFGFSKKLEKISVKPQPGSFSIKILDLLSALSSEQSGSTCSGLAAYCQRKSGIKGSCCKGCFSKSGMAHHGNSLFINPFIFQKHIQHSGDCPGPDFQFSPAVIRISGTERAKPCLMFIIIVCCNVLITYIGNAISLIQNFFSNAPCNFVGKGEEQKDGNLFFTFWQCQGKRKHAF